MGTSTASEETGLLARRCGVATATHVNLMTLSTYMSHRMKKVLCGRSEVMSAGLWAEEMGTIW